MCVCVVCVCCVCVYNITKELQIVGSSNRWSHHVVITPGYFLSGGLRQLGAYSRSPSSSTSSSTSSSSLHSSFHSKFGEAQSGPSGTPPHTHTNTHAGRPWQEFHSCRRLKKSLRSFPRLWAHAAGISAPVSRFQLALSPGVWSLNDVEKNWPQYSWRALTYCLDMLLQTTCCLPRVTFRCWMHVEFRFRRNRRLLITALCGHSSSSCTRW